MICSLECHWQGEEWDQLTLECYQQGWRVNCNSATWVDCQQECCQLDWTVKWIELLAGSNRGDKVNWQWSGVSNGVLPTGLDCQLGWTAAWVPSTGRWEAEGRTNEGTNYWNTFEYHNTKSKMTLSTTSLNTKWPNSYNHNSLTKLYGNTVLHLY